MKNKKGLVAEGYEYWASLTKVEQALRIKLNEVVLPDGRVMSVRVGKLKPVTTFNSGDIKGKRKICLREVKFDTRRHTKKD